MDFSVCLEALFRGRMTEGFDALARLGFPYAEFWMWTNKDIKEIRKASLDSGVGISAMCTSEFNLTDPEKRDAYVEGIRKSLETADFLNCKTLISQVGNDIGDERAAQHESIVEGLKLAAEVIKGTGVTLVIEPLNTRVNHKGYYLESSDEAFAIVDEVNSENVKVLFDIYHQQITEGDILAHMLPNLGKIGHIHAAGVPGRHELTDNELDYGFIFRKLKEAGCMSKIGLEYLPTFKPEAGLKLLKTQLIDRYGL